MIYDNSLLFHLLTEIKTFFTFNLALILLLFCITDWFVCFLVSAVAGTCSWDWMRGSSLLLAKPMKDFPLNWNSSCNTYLIFILFFHVIVTRLSLCIYIQYSYIFLSFICFIHRHCRSQISHYVMSMTMSWTSRKTRDPIL